MTLRRCIWHSPVQKRPPFLTKENGAKKRSEETERRNGAKKRYWWFLGNLHQFHHRPSYNFHPQSYNSASGIMDQICLHYVFLPRKGNVFKSVCHSFCLKGGICLGVCIQGGLPKGVCLRGICLMGVCSRGVCLGVWIQVEGLHLGVCIRLVGQIPPIRYYGIRSTSEWYASYQMK